MTLMMVWPVDYMPDMMQAISLSKGERSSEIQLPEWPVEY